MVASESAAIELTTLQVSKFTSSYGTVPSVPYDDDVARQEFRKVKTLSIHNMLPQAYMKFVKEFRNRGGVTRKILYTHAKEYESNTCSLASGRPPK